MSLLNKELIDKEINAVNSEFLKNINNDSWRAYNLLKINCNPDSCFSKFGTGSSKTLSGDNIHEKVNQFYNKEYR